tara:strand:- start:4912 stop:5637 length:726 start_codon:yes stop_codon:yes gene_type:complete
MIKTFEQLQREYQLKLLFGEQKVEGELTYNHANGFAHPLLWVLPQEQPGHMTPMMWGLIPEYEKGEGYVEYYKKTIQYGSGLNAQSEKLFSSGMYKNSGLHRRCIIPVDGFYEPHTAPKNHKVPFYFSARDGSSLNLAGIYTVTRDKFVTFSILTKIATPLFEKIHNIKKRRPVILDKKDIDAWLSEGLDKLEVDRMIGNDLPDEHFSAYPISRDLYSPKVDSNRDDIVELVHDPILEIDY